MYEIYITTTYKPTTDSLEQAVYIANRFSKQYPVEVEVTDTTTAEILYIAKNGVATYDVTNR